MTDRESMELLELAAKAAGKRIVWERPYVATGDFAQVTYDAVTEVVWNPLTDDGDALRLAVKLGMNLNLDGDLAEASASGCGAKEQFYERSKDKADAARRAIVRCAAKIGKKMGPSCKS